MDPSGKRRSRVYKPWAVDIGEPPWSYVPEPSEFFAAAGASQPPPLPPPFPRPLPRAKHKPFKPAFKIRRSTLRFCPVLHSTPIYSCEPCNFHSTRPLLYHFHAQSAEHFEEIENQGRTFRCQICARTIAIAQDFRRHLGSKAHQKLAHK